MKTILVTGGCGFIGSCFVRKILSSTKAISVIVADKLTYAGNLGNLEQFWFDPRLSFKKVDITDKKKMDAIFRSREIDTVVHFAAETHVDRSIKDATPFIKTNVLGTQVLLDACKIRSIERFVQVSTDEVYGALNDDEPAFTEGSPLRPTNPYSASKAAADFLVQAYHHTHGMPCIITRCSNDYGPYQFPEKFIPVVISKALDDESIPVYGRGQNLRDWVHVEDHCNGILQAIEHGMPGEIYNFGGGGPRRNIEVVNMILDIMGKPESLITFVEDRPGHDYRYAMDFQKASKELGWAPAMTFEDGLRATIVWYQEHPEWIESIKTKTYLNCYRDYKQLVHKR
ncbi:MAG TPA: dTDP-glucose 4,6-dehydratase [Candidatus Lokiarchaeia archaeon]|nr:dTDP-glucose 4,6-dehydratase [Candidatus Lokiarchaeia archaeon]